MLKILGVGAAAMVLASAGSSGAVTNLVHNGDFEKTTNGVGLLGYETNVVDWTDGLRPNGQFGEDYVYAYGTADTKLPKYPNPAGYDNGELYGPTNGGASSNHMPAGSPNGGNFVGLNGGVDKSEFSQTIGGLVAGKTYYLTFDYAYAQGFGDQKAGSVDTLSATLGNSTFSTPTAVIPSKGFSGWFSQTFVFKDFAGPDTLSFLSNGTSGDPPFALLDSVTLTSAVPEPAAWVMMLLGVAGAGAVMRQRRTARLTA